MRNKDDQRFEPLLESYCVRDSDSAYIKHGQNTRLICFIGGRAKRHNNCIIKWRLGAKQTRSEIGKLSMGKIEDDEGIFNCPAF